MQLPLISGPTRYPLPFPQGADQGTWFEGAFAFVNINLGGPYTLLIERWVELERLHRWQGKATGLMGKNIRPAELTSWIDSGRYGKRGKKIVIISAHVTAFGEKVWTWWMYLQPEWRKKGTNNRPLPVTNFGGNWKSLDHYGPNGWLSLLACLRWWGECLAKMQDCTARKKGTEEWLFAVNDMAKMLEGLILYKQK